jgi:Ca-activated chloride channel family protein
MTVDLYWREPLWLVALAYPLLAAAFGRWRKRRQIEAYADRHLRPWVQGPRRRAGLARQWLLVLAWSLGVVGLAGPRVPLFVPPDARPEPGALVAVLDLSGSMEARDLGGSRRAAALRALRSLVAEPRRPAIGLVVYAGRAHLYSPPTTDDAVLDALLAQAHALRLPTLGNDLASALTLAGSQLAGVAGPRGVLLLSDGDLDSAAQERAERAAVDLHATGAALAVVGVGTAMPTPVPDGDRGWLLHDGRPVVSRLEEGWLRQLAEVAGGRYLRLPEATALPLDALWQTEPPRIASDRASAVQWRELFPWLVVPAVVLLVLAAALPPRHATALVVAAVLSGAMPVSEAAGPDLAAAQEALAAGDAVAARDRYRSIAGFAGRYGEGVACYRLADFGCAIDAFSAAAWLAAKDDERARAAYSLAAAFYQEADYAQAAALYRDARANGLDEPALDGHIALTETLAAQVERHRREAAGRQARKGAGSRSGPPELADQVAVGRTLEPAAEEEPPLPAEVDRKRFEELVARGVERARLAATSAGGAATRHPSRWLGRDDAVVEIPGALLWQRLFEIEEGFLVSPERPRPRPAEQAW